MITDPSGIFTESIKAPNTSIIPLVLFVREGSLKKTISTNSININFGVDNLLYFEPLLLNIPSIRESVDFENRNFKIGNISLSISNSAHKNNDRFSDSLPDIINSTCIIYWKVPRAKTLFDCLSVYTGKVKRMTHDDTKVTLQIEDQTQENLHKDLPIEFVSSDLEILDKYKNKPIPFVYGENINHKIVMQPKNNDTDDLEVLADNNEDIHSYITDKPLKLVYDNTVMNLTKNINLEFYEDDELFEYSDSQQYFIEDNKSITLVRNILLDAYTAEENEPLKFFNTISNDQAEVIYEPKQNIFLNKEEFENINGIYYDGQFRNINLKYNNSSQEFINKNILLDNIIDNNYANITTIGQDLPINICKITKSYNSLYNRFDINTALIVTTYSHVDESKFLFKKNYYNYSVVLKSINHIYENPNGSADHPIIVFARAIFIEDGILGFPFADFYNLETDNNLIYNAEAEQGTNHKITKTEFIVVPENLNPQNQSYMEVDLEYNLYNTRISSIGLLNDIFKNEFCVDIKGRKGIENQDYDYSLIRNKNITVKTALFYKGMPDVSILFFYKDMINIPKLINVGDIINVFTEDNELYFKATIIEIINDHQTFAFDDIHTDVKLGNITVNGEVYTDLEIQENLETQDVFVKIEQPYIELPCDIMRHLLINDIGFNGAIQQDDLEVARNEHNGFYFSISQTEKINSKELFENIAKQSKFFPKFRNDGSFGFNTIKDIYTKDDAELIEIRDIINYKFDRTKIDDLKTKVKVIYGKDNITDEYLKSTPYLEASNYFQGYVNSYYGLEDDHRTSTLDFEAEYIQHEQTALLLRNFLMAWYANQHNIVSVDLPLKYMKYEIGDVVQFDSLINNLKLYGEDYTEIVLRNGQDIYPYFMIMETNKNIDKISLKLVQLHKNIVPEEQPQDDGINRSIKPPKGGFIAEQVENALNRNPSLANIQELTNER